MKCLRRALARAAFHSPLLLALAFYPSALAQQTTGEAGQSTALTRPNPDTVVLNVTVLNKKGAYVDGLEKSYFTVLENDKPREVTFFKGQEDEPVSVGIIYDASASMPANKNERVRDSLSRFMRESHPENDYFLIGFNNSPQLLAEWTRDTDQILSTLTSIKPKSNTALFDACYLGVEKVLRGRHPRRVLLLISDGQDNNSRFTFTELRKLLEESDVMLYSIGILGGADPGSSLGMEGQAILGELSGIGGGAAYFPETSKELDAMFGRIAYELRHQYQLGFQPADESRDGKWHKIKVKVTVPPGAAPPGLKIAGVRTRAGYYATKNPH